MSTLVEILTRTEHWLRERGIPSPRMEAERILSHVLGLPRLSLYLQYDRPLTADELAAVREPVRRRGQREPLAWVLGEVGFHDLDLLIAPGVLVPRPDTETLVDAALEAIPEGADPVYVADVGCGSGAVGLAVAKQRPGVRVYAIDKDPTALEVTRSNVTRLGFEQRVAVLAGDLLGPIPDARPIDWVLSNPPYVESAAIDGLEPEVSRHEPRLALDGGADGLDVYRRLVPLAARRARRGVLLEVGHTQAARVLDLMRRAGLVHLRTHKDLAGIDRVVEGRRGGSSEAEGA